MSFVTCELTGRLGNQIFEIATAMTVALDNKVPYLVPNKAGGSECYFDHFPLFNPDIYKVENIDREKGHQYKPIQYKPNLLIEGYRQSELYFKHRRNEVLEAFGFHWQKMEGMVALHIRRGDLVTHQRVTPLCKMSYYNEAIKYFTNKGYKDFLVFSDDIPWCKESFKQPVNFSFVENTNGKTEQETAKNELALMSCCEHQIIANSTFSWWGAWLNQSPDKIVIAPHKSQWFGAITRLNMDTVIPNEWIQIMYV